MEKWLSHIKGIDIYLLDQAVKGLFEIHHSILDAGCGTGRNLKLFNEGFNRVYACDRDSEAVLKAKERYPKFDFTVCDLENLSYSTTQFDRIVCNAVLHFATSKDHFIKMFSELNRVLKKDGILFIRMTSNIGLSPQTIPNGDGVFKLADGTSRFLLTPEVLEELFERFSLEFVEPLKTVNVNELRCMSTLVLRKVGQA